MKFSLKWLQKFITLNTTPEKLAEQLTDIGLEVEEVNGDIIDVSVPPNRADCLGVVGIAREAAAANSLEFNPPKIAIIPSKINDKLTIKVEDSKTCAKYLSRIIRGVDNTKSTPDWMRENLENAGINCISPVVDVTNYVLLELGQPLHAYDLQQVNGGIVVRKAKSQEALTLLGGVELKLSADTLVIADEKKSLSIAGIMGGEQSSITSNTKDIVLESAYFDPIAIRLTARKYGLQTDSSYRFERGIDVNLREAAIERATELLLEIVGGQAGHIERFVDEKFTPKALELKLRLARITRIIGVEVPVAKAVQILQHLGMQVKEDTASGILSVTVPTFRTDITREIDLVEEVVRIFGYGNVPEQIPTGQLVFNPQPEENISEERIVTCLLNRGYNEAITYSFIDHEFCKPFVAADSIRDDLCITNPISADMSLMRPSLLPGLVNALLHNQNRQQSRVRLFETGLRFVGAKKDLQQIKTIAGVCCGSYLPEGWASAARDVDFFDVKADVMALFSLANNTDKLEFVTTTDVALHPGQALDIKLNGKTIGKLGAIHPALQQSLGVINPVFVFEVDYSAVADGHVVAFNNFSKFPAVRRDLALLVNTEVQYAKLDRAIRENVGELLTDLVIFDVYQGKGIVEGKKSLAIGLTLQNVERTLTDMEVGIIFSKLVGSLERDFGASLR